ncbi:helix-turn-helix domain-containing protein [Streptomyces nanhaiensis]|jgi:excisionase family DNA binding protein|uniref:helix-turn-helix domain-containing protein n=1 Tax=Streptomyces TaxID=1883 RepID=UPI0022B71C70|nr:helix-turn-helix domain-containing protein [Streptomyces sp. WMMC1477]MCZ7434523.1 helix-turn-helix domain-containing protein [Streptomyces sp. WMMC1477]
MSSALPDTYEVLTVPEVMAALRMSRSKVYDLIRSGTLPSYTEGRSRRVPADSLRTYIRSKLQEAA